MINHLRAVRLLPQMNDYWHCVVHNLNFTSDSQQIPSLCSYYGTDACLCDLCYLGHGSSVAEVSQDVPSPQILPPQQEPFDEMMDMLEMLTVE